MGRVPELPGVAAITLHGRTKVQMYAGTANWDAIREVKQALTIPVIANGDVFSAQAGVSPAPRSTASATRQALSRSLSRPEPSPLLAILGTAYWKAEISKITTLEDVYRITAGIQRELRDPPQGT